MPENDFERNVHPVYGQTQATAQDAVCGINALLHGETRAHRRVGYKNSVARFHMLTMSKCAQISNELYTRTYRPQKGEKHEVFEPKYRLTVSSKYRDRVPQASFVINYFYPHVIPNLISTNCACIKGRGVDMARDLLKEILRNANMDDWCVKVDMQSYFASIAHKVLYEELGGYIVDDWAMWFFQTTVKNTGRTVGLDLGSEVYQLSATSLPNSMDHRLDNGKYVRYQDDLIMVGSKEECKEYLRIVREEAARLKLTISEKKTFAQPIKRPVKFLGFSFLRHPSGRVTMKRLPEKLRHEKRKLRRMKNKGIPIERVQDHYRGARACLSKGSRSDAKKMDELFENLFGGQINDHNQEGQCSPQAQGSAGTADSDNGTAC